MKTLEINQIEIAADNTVQIQFAKFSSDGDMLGYHRTAVESNGDIAAQLSAVDAHLQIDGFAPLSSEAVSRVQAVAAAAWNLQK